jgi:cytochrome b
VIHLGGVVVSSWLHGENLVTAMITGWKKRST